MPDREKVINGLTCRLECGCMNEDHCNSECPYLEDPRACYGLDEDALALLKSQRQDARRDYEAAVEMVEYCEHYEPTYDPETGAM